MATDDLPDSFDVVVIGTGLPESIVAAACSRAGHSVLHVDARDFYGGAWSSYSLDSLVEELNTGCLFNDVRSDAIPTPPQLESGERFIPVGRPEPVFRDADLRWFAKPDPIILDETGDSANVLSSQQAQPFPSDDHPELEPIPSPCETDTCAAQNITTDVEPEPDVPQPDQGGDTDNIAVPDSTITSTTPNADNADDNQVEPNTAVSPRRIVKPPTPPMHTRAWFDHTSRRFSIDLTPKILLSRGEFVELLIRSGVCRYVEFKTVDRILAAFSDDDIRQMPCSRAEVFQADQIDMLEKRMLMKFVKFCLNYESETAIWHEYAGRDISEFLNAQKLTDTLRHYIINALAMVKPTVHTEVALERIRKFLMSAGRYGNSPFLFPLYGAGELPQCFCRLCAVYGGIYCLRKSIDGVIVQDNRIAAVVSDGRRIQCNYLVVNSAYWHDGPAKQVKQVLRCCLITDKSLKPSSTNSHLSILSSKGFTFLEFSSSSMICPDGVHIVYINSEVLEDLDTSKHELENVIQELFSGDSNSSKPSILFRMTYIAESSLKTASIENLRLTCSNTDSSLNFEACCSEAKILFESLYPDDEFLPQIPDQQEEEAESNDNDPGINGFTPDASADSAPNTASVTENAPSPDSTEDAAAENELEEGSPTVVANVTS